MATTETPDRRSLVRAFMASLSGTTLEYYDFAAYSVASATILGKLFFPSSDELASTMLAFSTYAVGYLSRPLGGFIFGRLGDILGRKQVLVFTLLLTGIATFLIGVLPTHAALGGFAAILLVLLRFAQGVGVGGEWGGAVLLSSEFGDAKRRGFWASAAQIGPPAPYSPTGCSRCWPDSPPPPHSSPGAGGSRSCSPASLSFSDCGCG